MGSGPERRRGDRWAERLRAEGWWVQKLPASSTAGIPDWIRGHQEQGLWFTEAKTLEATAARGPRAACTRAQQFFLDQVVRYQGRASVLVLSEEGYLDLDWRDVDRAPWHRGDYETWVPYQVGAA